jgi:hypothetical protein
LTEAVFVDAQAGARADVDITDSVFPEFFPSTELTIPTVDMSAMTGSTASGTPATYPDWARTPGATINTYSPILSTEYYSSFIVPTASVTSIQMDLIGYTGTIKVQAAENYQSIFYNVTDSVQYYNRTGTVHIHVIGYYPILRLAFNNSVYTTGLNGQIGNPAQATALVSDLGEIVGATIIYKGNGYLAPPLIEFVGNGAGARATADVNLATGELTAINIIDGGSGYRPIPPTNTQAQIVISTGRAENILYR